MVPLYQPMPAKRKPRFFQPTLPSFRGSDRRGVIEQPLLLFVPGQLGEPGMERVVGWQEGLLAMEDGRVGAARIVDRLGIPRAEQQVIHLPAGLGVTAEEGPDVALEGLC